MSELRTAEVDDLLEVLVGVHDTDTAFALLEDLFTIREIKETSQRLAVARMLSAGKPYVAIEDATGASATTIARVSKALNYGSGGYRAALEVLDGVQDQHAADAETSAKGKAASAEGPAKTKGAAESKTGIKGARK